MEVTDKESSNSLCFFSVLPQLLGQVDVFTSANMLGKVIRNDLSVQVHNDRFSRNQCLSVRGNQKADPGK